jgi:hypothetical protein
MGRSFLRAISNQALYTLPGSPLTSITDLAHAQIGVADAMYQFHMLTQPFHVSSMLG